MEIEGREVEAYVKTDKTDQIVLILKNWLGRLDEEYVPEIETLFLKRALLSIQVSPCQDGFISVLARGRMPWPSSPAFARALSKELACIARCDPEDEYPEVSPLSYTFLQIENGCERLVDWV